MSASETIAAFCREHSVPFDCLRGRERFRDVVRLRYALIVRLRMQGFRVMRIARLLDKDHATVIRALKIAGGEMNIRIITGECRAVLRSMLPRSVQCCVTSPPYFGLRDYGHAGQIGLEPTPAAFVAAMVEVFRAVRDVLADDGTLWLNLGDSYAANGGPGAGGNAARMGRAYQQRNVRPAANGGLKPKDLIGIPWRVAFALQADGWYLRQDIIWHKPNPMPESVRDRCTKAHEYIFLLSKSERYFFDGDALREPAACAGQTVTLGDKSFSKGQAAGANVQASGNGRAAAYQVAETRNRRSVWTVATQPYSGAHFATYPPDLIEPCILAGSRPGDTVLDPFFGAGTTGLVADRLGRNAIGIELNPEYAALAENRIRDEQPMFADVVREAAE